MTEKRNILVTGGAGYIGSHAVHALLDSGYTPIVLDNLSTGTRENIPDNIDFYRGCISDTALIGHILSTHTITGVLHFAGSIIVSESVIDPAKYYQNNTCNSLSLIRACAAHAIDAFVFSSTAAVYGEPARVPIHEEAALTPINPYGHSKLMTEKMLQDIARASNGGLHYGILRYFNVAGADPQQRCGQSGPNATHLIKIACEVATQKREHMDIYGTDYPTPDGTCIRDYIHVSDLADLHVLTLEYILSEREDVIANCGYGLGFSVREVVQAVEHSANKKLSIKETSRRTGDPACLIACSNKIRELLKWKPQYDDLAFIVKSALLWEERLAKRKQPWQ